MSEKHNHCNGATRKGGANNKEGRGNIDMTHKGQKKETPSVKETRTREKWQP